MIRTAALNQRAATPDRLLEGEDPNTPFARDVRHWIAVYREMIEFKEGLLARVDEQLKRLPGAGRSDVIDNDISLITNQLARYRRRLEFWYGRQWQLEGIQIDNEQRTVTFRDRAMTLTRRELQLFELLVNRSPNYISPSRLLVEAWHDGHLPEETLRTYMARLRVKLESLGAPAQIKNRPRHGYAILFSEPTNAAREA